MEEKTSPFIEWNQEIRAKQHHLVLLDQENTIHAVTFHLSDSLPAKEYEELNRLKKDFENLNPKPWDKETHQRYRKLIGRSQENLLDKGYGSCILKDPDTRKILEDAINFYNEKFYDLYAYVIMPNHVHLLLKMREGYEIEKILGRIKSFSSRKINEMLGRKGGLWVKENYCRMQRSEEHYKISLAYIKENPRFLKRGEFSLKIF